MKLNKILTSSGITVKAPVQNFHGLYSVHDYVKYIHVVICACTCTHTLSREKVLVTAKLHPASNARRIMAELVVGVADARPNGFSNLRPHISMLMSTKSTGV